MGKYIDGSGLSHFMGIIKGAFVSNVSYDTVNKLLVKTKGGTDQVVAPLSAAGASGSYNDLSDKPTIPSANSTATNILMDGTQSAGSLATFARADHVHPSDTSRVPTTRKVNGKALSADVSFAIVYGRSEDAPDTLVVSISSNDNVTNTDFPIASTSNSGLMASGDKTKLNGIATGAEVNQNAFSNVKVGSTTVAADAKTDTLELVAGSNVTLTPDSTNDKVTIASTDTNTTYTLTQDSTDGHKLTFTPSSGTATTITIPDNDTTALGSMTGTLGVGHGGTGVSTLGAGVVYHSASGTGALSIATAANLVSALGTTAVNRATADASGNNIASTYAKLASPALTGTPTAPTAAAGTNSTQIATTAFVANAVGTATAGALQYKGTVDAESTITGAAYKKGWYYVVSTAGTYVGKVCEVGDMLIAKQDKTSTPANDWDVVQSNIETLSNGEIDALWAAA